MGFSSFKGWPLAKHGIKTSNLQKTDLLFLLKGGGVSEF
jgi:hypothetical protein